MIKILKAFNKIETQSRAVLRCKVTQEVHWVREGVLEIDFFIFLKSSVTSTIKSRQLWGENRARVVAC